MERNAKLNVIFYIFLLILLILLLILIIELFHQGEYFRVSKSKKIFTELIDFHPYNILHNDFNLKWIPEPKIIFKKNLALLML